MPKRSEFPKFNFEGIRCEAKCVEVYDGDTFTLELPLGHIVAKYDPDVDKNQLPTSIYLRCRSMHYNSAEIRGKTQEERDKAIIDRDYLKSIILEKQLQVAFGENDMYGRPLTLVTLPDDVKRVGTEVMLHEHMLASGHGRPYEGKGEKNWH